MDLLFISFLLFTGKCDDISNASKHDELTKLFRQQCNFIST